MNFVRRIALLILLAIPFGPRALGVTVDWDASGHVGIVVDLPLASIPEINPAWTAFGSCLIAALLVLRHSGKFRK